jgi:hypothetical protein
MEDTRQSWQLPYYAFRRRSKDSAAHVHLNLLDYIGGMLSLADLPLPDES